MDKTRCEAHRADGQACASQATDLLDLGEDVVGHRYRLVCGRHRTYFRGAKRAHGKEAWAAFHSQEA